MNARRPPIDLPAARRAAVELASVIEELEHGSPPAVNRVKLPLALEVLDHCAGDPVMAICLIAGLVDPSAARVDQTETSTPEPAARTLRLVTEPNTPLNRRNAL